MCELLVRQLTMNGCTDHRWIQPTSDDTLDAASFSGAQRETPITLTIAQVDHPYQSVPASSPSLLDINSKQPFDSPADILKVVT